MSYAHLNSLQLFQSARSNELREQTLVLWVLMYTLFHHPDYMQPVLTCWAPWEEALQTLEEQITDLLNYQLKSLFTGNLTLSNSITFCIRDTMSRPMSIFYVIPDYWCIVACRINLPKDYKYGFYKIKPLVTSSSIGSRNCIMFPIFIQFLLCSWGSSILHEEMSANTRYNKLRST